MPQLYISFHIFRSHTSPLLDSQRGSMDQYYILYFGRQTLSYTHQLMQWEMVQNIFPSPHISHPCTPAPAHSQQGDKDHSYTFPSGRYTLWHNPQQYTPHPRIPTRPHTKHRSMGQKHIFHSSKHSLCHISCSCRTKLVLYICHQHRFHVQDKPYCYRNMLLTGCPTPRGSGMLGNRKYSSPTSLMKSMRKRKVGISWWTHPHSHRSRGPHRRECNPQENWLKGSKGRGWLLEHIHDQCMWTHRDKRFAHKYKLLRPRQ